MSASTPAPDAATITAGPAAARTVYLETFGCQMNVLDSQLVRSQLHAAGYRFTDDWRRADVILYNTCSVREHAESKVYSRLGMVGQLKKERPEIVLGVLGCMAERDGVNMVRRYPQIDLLVGPGELDQAPLFIDNAVKTHPAQRGSHRKERIALQGNTHRRSGSLAAASDQLEMLDLSRSFSPDEHQGSAYVRITRGCNKFCTYCVVPTTRGAEVHRPPDHIVEECRRLVASGVREITLLGQTVNHYHFDSAAAVTVDGLVQPQIGAPVSREGVRQGKGVSSTLTTFADLLARIHDEVPQLPRLRFVTSFPRDFGDDILRVMAERPRLCRYIHLPVQTGSDRLLALMNRGYTVAEYRDTVRRIRETLPGVELCTDIICGFPTETEEDHRATAELLQWGAFKNAFIFKYSPRPGTAAFDRLPDDVPQDIKRRRNNELLALQAKISTAVHQAYVGKTVRVFVESVSEHARRDAAEANASAAVEAAGACATDTADVIETEATAPAHGHYPGTPPVTIGWAGASTPTSLLASSTPTAGVAVASPAPVPTQLTGRTDGDLIVCFPGSASMVGQIIDVHINRAAPLALFGRTVNT